MQYVMAEKWNLKRDASFSVPFSFKGNIVLLAWILGWYFHNMYNQSQIQSWLNMLLVSEIPVLSICQMMYIISSVPWVRLSQLRAGSVRCMQDFAFPFVQLHGIPVSLCHWALPVNLQLAQISLIPFWIVPFTLKTAILKASLNFFIWLGSL